MSLKFTWKFEVNKTQEVEKTETEMRDGQEVKVVKKVKEKVPVKFAILKPGRGLKEEAEIFHAGLMNEYVINKGLMTRQQLIKRYANDGGSMSEPEKQRYAALLTIILKEEENLERIQLNLDSLSEEERTKKIQNSTYVLVSSRNELGDIISAQNNLYEHTAETKAEEKTIFWWCLKLAYTELNGAYVPFFGPGTIAERIAKYDEMEESEDLFFSEIIKKFLWYIGMWYSGRISDEASFQRVTEEFKLGPSDEAPAQVVANTVEEVKVEVKPSV